MAKSDSLIKGVDFAGVPTQDLERACDFYGNRLGLPRAVYYPERNFAEFETGNLTLSVYNAEAMGMQHNRSPNPIALHVDDVHEARAAFEQNGVGFMGDVVDTGVCHMAFFADPDGNALMLHHRYAPRQTES